MEAGRRSSSRAPTARQPGSLCRPQAQAGFVAITRSSSLATLPAAFPSRPDARRPGFGSAKHPLVIGRRRRSATECPRARVIPTGDQNRTIRRMA